MSSSAEEKGPVVGEDQSMYVKKINRPQVIIPGTYVNEDIQTPQMSENSNIPHVNTSSLAAKIKKKKGKYAQKEEHILAALVKGLTA